MNLRLENAGKRFGKQWVFRNLELDLPGGSRLAILGKNGSGKSTLAQTLTGYISLNEGKLIHDVGNPEELPLRISYAAPYLEIPDDYNLRELAAFHFRLRKSVSVDTEKNFSALLQLEHAQQRCIHEYSSGMRQRVKLGLALLTQSELVVIDEPHSNLDADAKRWLQQMLTEHLGNRSLLICSNHQEEEYAFCDKHLDISKR